MTGRNFQVITGPSGIIQDLGGCYNACLGKRTLFGILITGRLPGSRTTTLTLAYPLFLPSRFLFSIPSIYSICSGAPTPFKQWTNSYIRARLLFLEKTYALSKVIHIIQYPNPAKQKTEKLRLLDAIALLLVTEAKSNAAVSLERRTGEVVFKWAKNNAVTSEDQDHLSHLIDIATSNDPNSDRVEGLLMGVMKTCRHAVFSRIENLKIAIKKNGSLLSNVSNTPNQVGWRQYLDKFLAEYFDTKSGVDLVLAYFRCFPELEVDALSADQLEILVMVASVIGSYDQTEEVLRDPTIMKRLRLVGDYLGACERVVESVDRNQELKIRFVAVSEAVPYFCCSILTVLGGCGHTNQDPLTWGLLGHLQPLSY